MADPRCKGMRYQGESAVGVGGRPGLRFELPNRRVPVALKGFAGRGPAVATLQAGIRAAPPVGASSAR